jgi:hypothetical protein
MKKIRINLGGFYYKLLQDLETGALEVESVSKEGFLKKVVSYAKAEASGLVGSVSLPVLDERQVSCESCESLKIVKSDEWYCKSCGCPEWERSRLQVKWELPAATCPLGKWTG